MVDIWMTDYRLLLMILAQVVLIGFALTSAVLFYRTAGMAAKNLSSLAWRRIIVYASAFAAILPGLLCFIFFLVCLALNAPEAWLFLAISIIWVLTFLTVAYRLRMQFRTPQPYKYGAPRSSSIKLYASGFVFFAVLSFIGWYEVDQQLGYILSQKCDETRQAVTAFLPAKASLKRNAVDEYKNAAVQLLGTNNLNPGPALNELPRFLYKSLEPEFDPSDRAIKAFLTKHAQALSSTRTAASMPIDYGEIIITTAWFDGTRNDYFYIFRPLAHFVSLDAIANAKQGKMQAALTDIQTLLAMSKQLNQMPLMIHTILGTTVEDIALRCLEKVLALGSWKHVNITRGQIPEDGHGSYLKSIHHDLMFEIGVNFQSLKDLHRNGLNPRWKWKFDDIFFFEPRLQPWEDELGWMAGLMFDRLSPFRTFFTLYELPLLENTWAYVESLDTSSPIAAVCSVRQWNEERNIPGFINPDGFSTYFEYAIKGDATRSLTRLALAAMAYRSKYGKFPEKKADLVSEYMDRIPNDPFDGKPIRMRHVRDGLILYSVGSDLSDEKGMETAWDPSKEIAFYLGSAYTEYRVKPAINEDKRSALNRIVNRERTLKAKKNTDG